MKVALLRRLFTIVCRDICEIDIVSSGLLIPTKHGVDSFGELCDILLVNAVGIYLEVSKTISRSLVRVELYLLLSSLGKLRTGEVDEVDRTARSSHRV